MTALRGRRGAPRAMLRSDAFTRAVRPRARGILPRPAVRRVHRPASGVARTNDGARSSAALRNMRSKAPRCQTADNAERCMAASSAVPHAPIHPRGSAWTRAGCECAAIEPGTSRASGNPPVASGETSAPSQRRTWRRGWSGPMRSCGGRKCLGGASNSVAVPPWPVQRVVGRRDARLGS